MDGGGVERDDEKSGERSGWKWEEAQHLRFGWFDVLVSAARSAVYIFFVFLILGG
jgi:hypothetical protein